MVDSTTMDPPPLTTVVAAAAAVAASAAASSSAADRRSLSVSGTAERGLVCYSLVLHEKALMYSIFEELH